MAPSGSVPGGPASGVGLLVNRSPPSLGPDGPSLPPEELLPPDGAGEASPPVLEAASPGAPPDAPGAPGPRPIGSSRPVRPPQPGMAAAASAAHTVATRWGGTDRLW